jgi:hypothetical protein
LLTKAAAQYKAKLGAPKKVFAANDGFVTYWQASGRIEWEEKKAKLAYALLSFLFFAEPSLSKSSERW